MDQNEQILALREAGQVRRSHTQISVGEYNIAMHCWNAVNLLLILHPKQPRLSLIKAVMWHDVPERWTGDVPAPAKWKCPELKIHLDAIENVVFKKLEIQEPFDELLQSEIAWLQGVDLLELYLWVRDQVELGNRHIVHMRGKIMTKFLDNQDYYPREIIRFLEEFVWKRMPELDGLMENKDDSK